MSLILEAVRNTPREALQRLDGMPPEVAIAQRIPEISDTVAGVLFKEGGEEELALPRLIDIFNLRVGQPVRLPRKKGLIFAFGEYFTVERKVTIAAPESASERNTGIPGAITIITRLTPCPLGKEAGRENPRIIIAQWSHPAEIESETGRPNDIIYTGFHLQERNIYPSDTPDAISILQCSINPRREEFFLSLPLNRDYNDYGDVQKRLLFDFNGYPIAQGRFAP